MIRLVIYFVLGINNINGIQFHFYSYYLFIYLFLLNIDNQNRVVNNHKHNISSIIEFFFFITLIKDVIRVILLT